MLTSSIDANFCNNYNNHCEISILDTSFSLLQIFTLNGTKMSSHTVHIKTFVHFLFFLVLNWKIKTSEWQHFTVYRSTFVKGCDFLFSSFFFSPHFSFLQWCTINVMYSCVATSETTIQLRWIPFFLSINIIELCTLMYLFTFCISFQSVGVPRWAGCKIDTVLNCTVIDWKM